MPRTQPTRCDRSAAGRQKEVQVGLEQSTGGDRLRHDLETGQTIMKDVLTVDALSTILFLTTIETMYRGHTPHPIVRGRRQIPSCETEPGLVVATRILN